MSGAPTMARRTRNAAMLSDAIQHAITLVSVLLAAAVLGMSAIGA